MHINITPAEIVSVDLNSLTKRDTFIVIRLNGVGYLTLKKHEVERLYEKLGDTLTNWPED